MDLFDPESRFYFCRPVLVLVPRSDGFLPNWVSEVLWSLKAQGVFQYETLIRLIRGISVVI